MNVHLNRPRHQVANALAGGDALPQVAAGDIDERAVDHFQPHRVCRAIQGPADFSERRRLKAGAGHDQYRRQTQDAARVMPRGQVAQGIAPQDEKQLGAANRTFKMRSVSTV